MDAEYAILLLVVAHYPFYSYRSEIRNVFSGIQADKRLHFPGLLYRGEIHASMA
ncbi:hypothetical protein [Trichococcus ilyis]|uniref:hypothetical protein n=1 Tax=Trichococcus ilyis TaxID=640938 RepID=UPI0012ECE0BC|nr:hypothetical protein [Trichococcus ilyis]